MVRDAGTRLGGGRRGGAGEGAWPWWFRGQSGNAVGLVERRAWDGCVPTRVCAHLILSWRLPLWLGSPEPPSSLENLGVPPGRENQLCQRVLAAYCLLPPWPGFSSRGAGLRPGWVGQEGTVLCFHPNVLSVEIMEELGAVLYLPLPREAAPARFPRSWHRQGGSFSQQGWWGVRGEASPHGKVLSGGVSCGAGSFRHPGRGQPGAGDEACSRVNGGPQGLAHTAPCLLFGGIPLGSTPTMPPVTQRKPVSPGVGPCRTSENLKGKAGHSIQPFPWQPFRQIRQLPFPEERREGRRGERRGGEKGRGE